MEEGSRRDERPGPYNNPIMPFTGKRLYHPLTRPVLNREVLILAKMEVDFDITDLLGHYSKWPEWALELFLKNTKSNFEMYQLYYWFAAMRMPANLIEHWVTIAAVTGQAPYTWVHILQDRKLSGELRTWRNRYTNLKTLVNGSLVQTYLDSADGLPERRYQNKE